MIRSIFPYIPIIFLAKLLDGRALRSCGEVGGNQVSEECIHQLHVNLLCLIGHPLGKYAQGYVGVAFLPITRNYHHARVSAQLELPGQIIE